MKSKLNKAQEKRVELWALDQERITVGGIKEILADELSRQRKEIIKDIKNKKFERGQRQWCIQCANRICRFIEGKKLRKITY